jgi:hypothetical protein
VRKSLTPRADSSASPLAALVERLVAAGVPRLALAEAIAVIRSGRQDLLGALLAGEITTAQAIALLARDPS